MITGLQLSGFVALVAVALPCCRAATEGSLPKQAGSASPPSAEAPTSPEAKLAAMDQRTPVPLLPMMANHQKQNMRDHLLAVQEIIAAVATKDFDAVQSSVARIGYSEQMGRMCQHMGAGAPGFTELALKFHHGAERIGAAAKAQDSDAVLAALSTTLTTCTSCHQTFRQQVVDEGTWTSVTKTTPSAAPGQR
jgi:hypothetical protein